MKAEATRRAKGSSVSGVMKSMMRKGLGEGGMRDLTVRLPKMRRARMMKAAVRIAQGKPISGMRRWIMMGKMTPPREEPEATTPNAKARRRKNQVEVEERAG